MFNVIKPLENDQLSCLNASDLKPILLLNEQYYLELREGLRFDNNVTFGLEIEAENAKYDYLRTLIIEKFNNFVVKPDLTLKNGIEVNTPYLFDTYITWLRIKKVCDIMKKGSTIDNCSGGHIHIGAQVLGDKTESWLNFIKMWSVYENVIFRFLYGEYLTPRSILLEYAKPLAIPFRDIYQYFKDSFMLTVPDIVAILNKDKHDAINFKYAFDFENIRNKNTIEFRCPNGTLDAVIWQNNVNFLVKLLKYARSSRFDYDTVCKREKDISELTFEQYGQIYLEQSLELADLVFDNNLDKMYFLRQYLKSFEVGNRPLQKAKCFIKGDFYER